MPDIAPSQTLDIPRPGIPDDGKATPVNYNPNVPGRRNSAGMGEANLSRQQIAQRKAQYGQVINWCPFGCDTEELDGLGYCHHLIGFTKDKKEFEPLVDVGGGERRIQVRRDRIKLQGFEKPDKNGHRARRWKWGPPKLEKCEKGDIFERTTSEWRVYRDVPKPTTEEEIDENELEALTRPNQETVHGR